MSGFDQDPQFEIIHMPDDEQAATGQPETEEELDSQDGTDGSDHDHANDPYSHTHTHSHTDAG